MLVICDTCKKEFRCAAKRAKTVVIDPNDFTPDGHRDLTSFGFCSPECRDNFYDKMVEHATGLVESK